MLMLALPLLAALVAQPPTKSSPRAKKSTPRKASAKPAQPLHFVIAPEGNEARYRVRERLMNHDLDNDAIGATREITGTLVAYPDGRVVRDSSRIVVRVTSLKSDQERRDGFLQRRTLETTKYPTVELVPTSLSGLPKTLPTSGNVTFQLFGDLTIHGVTKPTAWTVAARLESGTIAGKATTAFTFADFALDQPRVPVVLSVADTVKLEFDFRFVPSTPTP
jgi:polyisoprenoid-binding protein YceI